MRLVQKFLILIAFLSNAVFAANETIPKDRTIEEITAYGNLVVVRISPAFDNAQNCSSGSNVWLQMNLDEDPTGTMYATMLAIASASKKVGFGIGGCNGQYPRIYRVDAKF